MTCECPQRPRCQIGRCDQAAAWSILRPRRVTFMCAGHHVEYRAGLTKPIKGLDPPPGAGDDWRASIIDMLNQARLDLAFEDKRRSRNRG